MVTVASAGITVLIWPEAISVETEVVTAFSILSEMEPAEALESELIIVS